MVEDASSPAGRVFDLSIQALIVISLISFCVETLPDLAPRTQTILRTLEVVTVGIFTAEYLLRLLAAERRLKYALSLFGLVDLLAILPFYVARGIDLRALRAIRLLRLFRALKLFRYSNAVQRLHHAFRLVREELTLFLSAALLLLFFAGVGIYYFERDAQPEAFGSIFHSLWWAVATLTTVGYGDAYPVTIGGRVFTFLVLMVGLGVVAVPAGMVASALSEARRAEKNGGGVEESFGPHV